MNILEVECLLGVVKTILDQGEFVTLGSACFDTRVSNNRDEVSLEECAGQL